MKKLYYLIFSSLLFLSFIESAKSQCPNRANTEATITFEDVKCFEADDGSISFELRDASNNPLDPADFSFSLFDGGSEGGYVYDDIGISPGFNIIPTITLTVSGNIVTFNNLPNIEDGVGYSIVADRDDGSCGSPSSYTQGAFGIIIDQPSELVASIVSVTDDCDNAGSGAIDIDVSGGTPDGGPYTYAWSNGEATQDLSNLSSGTYDVTITDDNNCIVELTGIVVEAGPIIQNVTNTNTDLCPDDDLVVNLDASETGVDYQVFVDGVGSSVEAGTGNALNITVPSGSFVDGDNITVQADDSNCPVVMMNGSFTVNITTISDQTINNLNPTPLCAGDDLTVELAGSESGVDYQVFVDGNGSTTLAGSGNALDILVPSADLVDGATITVVGTSNGCTFTLTDNFVIDITTIADQTINNLDPTIICTGDDLTVELAGSESGVDYQVFVDGNGSTTEAGTGNALDILVPNADIIDGATVTVVGSANGCTFTMTDNFVVNTTTIADQPINNLNPTPLCSGEDLTVELAGSESGVDYQVFVDGNGSTTEAGTGNALDILVPSADLVDGATITVVGTTGSCSVTMTDDFLIDITTIADQTINNLNPTPLCAGDDLTVELAGSESGVDYQVFVDGNGSTTEAGTGNALDILIPSADLIDGATITVVGSANGCTLTLTDDFVVNITTIADQTINNLNPTPLCEGDDLTVELAGSESGVDYQVFVDGNGSTTEAGTGNALDILVPSADLVDGATITVVGSANGCTFTLTDDFVIDITTIADQTINNLNPTPLCSGDDLTVELAGSESGVDYQVFVDGNGSTTEAGTGNALDILVPSADLVDGATITVVGSANSCTFTLTDDFVIDITTIADQTINNLDPTVICTGEDLTVELAGSESGVDYQVFVDGNGSTTSAGTGNALDILVPSADIVDGATITVVGSANGCTFTMTDNFVVNTTTIADQTINNLNPTPLCSGEDLTVELAGSESGVDYQVFVDGNGSTTEAGTGNALDILVPSGDLVDGATITVVGTTGSCSVTMTDDFVIDITTIADQTIDNLNPTPLCAGDDLTVELAGSELGVDYQVFVDGNGSTTEAGTGNALDILVPSADIIDGATITVVGSANGCTLTLTDDFVVNITSIADQTINNLNPTPLCAGDDLTVELAGSESGIDYQVFVDGNGSTTSTGTGNALDILVPSGDLVDGATITVVGTTGSCSVTMTDDFVIDITTIADQTIDNLNPTPLCSGDDLTVELAGSESGVDYQVFVDGNGSTTSAGTGNALDILVPSADLVDGATITVVGSANGCTFTLTDDFVIDITTIADQVIDNVDPTPICTGDDLTVELAGSESGVDYQVFVDGNGSTTEAGTGNALDILVPNADIVDGATITVVGSANGCTFTMTDEFVVNITTIAPQTIDNFDPVEVCPGDDLVIDLSGSENGVTYEVIIDGTASGITELGDGNPLSITVADGSFADGDVITIEGTTGTCSELMTGSTTVNVVEITATADITPTTGCAVNDGAIDLTPSSNSAGDTFSFSWIGPNSFSATTEDITDLDGGFYTVTITSDNTACSEDFTFEVEDPIPFNVNVLSINPQSECGVDNGGIDIEVTGGTGPYNYYIVDVNTSTEVSGSRSDADPSDTYSYNLLAPGDYEVFVEEGACTQSETFTVDPVDEIDGTVISTTKPSCGNADGVISLEVTDVGNDFDVTYDDGVNPSTTTTFTATSPTSVDLTGLAQGDYTITITDNTTNCEVVLNQLLNEDAPFDIDNSTTESNIVDIQTCGGNEGEINVAVTGTLTSPTYTWTGPTGFTDPGSTPNFTSIEIAGDYQVAIEDAGCTVVSDVYTITEPTPPTAVAGADSTVCEETLTLFADALGADQAGEWQIVSQPTGANATILDPNNPTSDIEDLIELGDYTLAWILENTITSCSDTDTVVITRKTITTADAGVDQEICEGVVSLSANAVGADETGTWSIVSEPAGIATSANFDDENVENTNFNIADLSVSGDYVIRWTISDDNNICIDSENELTISYEAKPSAGTFNSAPSVNLTSADSPFDLFTLLDDEDTGGNWDLTTSNNGGGTDPTFDVNSGEVDFDLAESGIYEFTYTVNGTFACATDSETVVIDFLNFECEDTKFTSLTEDATCQGVQDGSIFLFLQNVSNSSTLEAVINSVVMDTFSIEFANAGNGNLVQLDTTFFSGNYEVILKDDNAGCEDTISVVVGNKQSILPLVNTSDATCDNPVGQIQVTIDGTFDFVLLDADDNEIETNTTGLFTDLDPASYGIAFNNSGGCQVDTVKNIIINEPTQVSNSALDLTVVEPSCNTTRAQILINFELGGEYLYEILDEDGNVVESTTTDAGEWNVELDTLGVFELVLTNTTNPGLCEPSNRDFNIERSGGFTATVTDKTDVVCFGESTGSVTIELDGIGSGFYSLDGSLWNEFISGEPINDLPARRTILVSDQAGTSECELSVQVDIEALSQPIELDGNITLITQASCTTAEEVGEINVPEVSGGVAPYVYSIDGNTVELDSDRNISGLARNVDELIITDDTGCSISIDIRSIVSPNEIRAEVSEIEPNNNCLNEPEGLLVEIDQSTIDNVPGPYNLILNRVNDTITSEYVLNINTNGSNEFVISQFDVDNEIPFIKGARYRWTVRAVDNDQACSADNFVTINGGAIIPTFEIAANDVACFQESGSIELFNIEADASIPLDIEVYEGNDVEPTEIFTLNTIPQSGRFVIDQSIYGMMTRGDYIVKLIQRPENCGETIIESENASVFIDAPVAQLNVELVPEPNLPPGVERERGDMNPMPTSRPDRSNGSISIRLVEPTSGANGYSAQIFLITPLGGNNSSNYTLPSEPIEFGSDQTITFENLLPGVYEIEYYDSFGCGTDGNRLVFDDEGSSDITVDFDRRPFIPNVFTPNNDGKNDEFRILNLPDDGAELIITNRTGTIVYRNSNYRSSNLWDGGDNPDGIYFYQLKVNGSVQTGWVEILRGKR